MIFDIDKQTIRDLELFTDKNNGNSIYSIFNRTVTIGGQDTLYEMLNNPVSDFDFLQTRKEEINFFFLHDYCLKLHKRQLDYIEFYLKNRRFPLRDNIIDAKFDALSNKVTPNSDYYTISEGIFHIVQLLIDLNQFIEEAKTLILPLSLEQELEKIKKITSSKKLNDLFNKPPKQGKDLSSSQINRLDQLFRVTEKNTFRDLLATVYKIDVLQTLGQIMKNEGFCLPEYCSASQPEFDVVDGFHPFLSSPVKNSFSFNQASNLCFVTGANMSGKSTFLKTMGLMIYLSHVGLPVPAKSLKTPILNGLFTTINLTDNMNLGYSHFYSEVKRVKDLALRIKPASRFLIIFDELFRGTNVKDAYDASLMIISALAKIRNTIFFISTHILEIAETIENKETIMFRCFGSELVNQQPIYDFKLKEGISEERIGLLIIKNEGIPQILDEIVRKQEKDKVYNKDQRSQS
jgi:DNA mismatch repair ATPase MutS